MKTNPAIDVRTITSLTNVDLAFLCSWCDRQWELEQFQSFIPWLRRWATVELGERQNRGYEPGMLALPDDWSGQQLSDALLASYVLCRQPLNESLAAFADALALRITCAAAAILAEINFSVTGASDDER